jgi:2-methylcitrate dehydratase
MRKITVKENLQFAPPPGSAPPTRITATFNNGRRITREIDMMPGFQGQSMSRVDIERKFRSNVSNRWAKEQTDVILKSLWALEQADSVPSLLGKLTV